MDSDILSDIVLIPVLTVSFIGLKLGDVIDWSWWWVLSPLWIAATVFAFAFINILIVTFIYRLSKQRKVNAKRETRFSITD